jgi:DNA-binding transcriptional MocR family regulator
MMPASQIPPSRVGRPVRHADGEMKCAAHLRTFVTTHSQLRTESGELAPGARLPSIRSISQEYEVATTTAQKVLEALRDEGLVITSPMGTFVADRS